MRAPRDRPLELLLVVGTVAGGTGRHVRQLADGLAGRTGYRVRLAGPPDSVAPSVPPPAGPGLVPLRIAHRPRPLADLRTIHRLRDLARQCDVVHAHGLRAGALCILAVVTTRASRRPKVVVTLHNALASPGRGVALVHAALEWIVARGADVVLVVSADIGRAMTDRGARVVRPAVISSPPPPPMRRSGPALRAELGLGPEVVLLLTVARLAPQKGLPLLLDAVERVAAEAVPVRAVVAGDGPLAATLAAEITRRQLPVSLLGFRNDVVELLAVADIVVVPSVWEGQPLIVQEALRAGAAIVATDTGGTATLAGDGAVLVPAEPAALAGAVRTLIDDPGLKATLRRRAHERANRLPDADDAVQAALSEYRGLMRGPGGNSG